MKRDITPLTPRGETEIEMKRPMVSGVLYERGRASCQPQWRRGGAPEELLPWLLRLICARKDQHAQGSNLAQAAHGLQLMPCMMLHFCEAATATPSGDKNMLLQAGTALAGSGSAR